ncbi:DUF2955 domain-containing protein [Photobacterium lutimaris]|uniref:DUF2955 domain-containing protein n=1 Tax=Photobacterium lutimaris TaxID=388278 RepID=A0A2T3J4R2_9GAMM|nr:DUF2955 domain-containing protein [Photobacterium lutimaris]PSU36292.1 hypothetical protein C9I99_04645 [Photobacterium lutimaris]TDR74823.1 DUF2955 family protein [Photobacterium lutimaris]
MRSELNQNILRYVIGVMLSLILAYSLNWTLAYIMPVFVAKLLVDKPIADKQVMTELGLSMVVTVLIALTVISGLAEYPLIMLALVGVMMLWAYYLFQDPNWNFFATMLMISALLLPYLGLMQPAIALQVGKALMVTGGGAVVVFGVMHWLFPAIPRVEASVKTVDVKTREQVRIEKQNRMQESYKALLISFPVIAFCYFYQVTGAILTMIFIGILSLRLTAPKSVKLSLFLLLTNIIGGLLAIIAYELLVTVPWFPFLVAMMLFFTLGFANKIYREPAKAPIYAGVFSALMVIFGAVAASDSKLIDMNFYTRIWQLILMAGYMTGAATLIENVCSDKHAPMSKNTQVQPT